MCGRPRMSGCTLDQASVRKSDAAIGVEPGVRTANETKFCEKTHWIESVYLRLSSAEGAVQIDGSSVVFCPSKGDNERARNPRAKEFIPRRCPMIVVRSDDSDGSGRSNFGSGARTIQRRTESGKRTS